MKSLREARKASGLTQKEVIELTVLSPMNLSFAERGLTSPGETTRRRLQLIFDCKINWLDVPRLSIEPLDPPSDWISCERQFRRLIKELKSLPEDEQTEFIRSAKKHLGDINKQVNEK